MDKSRKKAVALQYRPARDPAPRVTAKGQGVIAQNMVDTAREAGVPVVQNGPLADALQSVAPETPIPEQAFVAVAGIYAFLMELDKQYATKIL